MRNQIKERLKGTLSAWKIDPKPNQHAKYIDLRDRIPIVGETEFTFDDLFRLGRKIGIVFVILGEGTSGSVYICEKKKDGKQYAVKISRGD